MVMEMTGSYGLLVPSLLVAAIAYIILPPRLGLYENQVPGRIDSPAHLGSFAVDILRRARIEDTWEPRRPASRTVPQDAPLPSLVDLASDSAQNLFPVVDGAGRLVGEFSIDDLRRALLSEEKKDRLSARDLMHHPVGPLVPSDDLNTAARLLAERRTDAVTVVREHASPEVLGVFTRRDLIVAYGRRLARLREDASEMFRKVDL